MRGDARILQAKIEAGEFEGYNVYSIVKETGIDDEGLNEVRYIEERVATLLLSHVCSSLFFIVVCH